MNDIQYLGENLWPGQLGHFFVILSFVSALFAAFAYFSSFKKRNTPESVSWLKLGRVGFITHGISIFGIIGILFYAMYHQMYEYNYVFNHVSPELPMRYILSAFWEGQEGSFLLWMFWHVILGFVLIKTAKKWEAPVMINFALIEAFIVTMILGIHIPWSGDEFRIGSNPTLLLRDVLEAPIFANADYLSLIEGTGMNALLQNYWMTIHPPTLFLGFASVAAPFSFALAGLWTGEHKSWLIPAAKWTAFSSFILGLGILMGGAWAYEALSFGGYWAWDPVENASFVPWIILIAGFHTNLVAKKTGYSIKSTYVFYILSFVLILYSTFLTRSGILGDTSAHAFTEMGLEWQLVGFIAFFLVLGFVSFLKNQKSIIQPTKEEHIASKEFWMFIGALVLFFSAILIIVSTSLPMFNTIVEYFKPGYEGKVIEDPIGHYNKYQLWIAVFIGFLSATAQLLRFKAFNWQTYKSTFLKHAVGSAVIALVCSYLFNLHLGTKHFAIWLLLFSAFFSIISNLDYLFLFLKGNLKLGASVISHIGFGILVLGILSTGLKNSFISNNEMAQRGIVDEESLATNIPLIKGEPYFANGYLINFEKDTVINRERKYKINFKKLDESNRLVDEFTTYPNFLYNKEFTKAEAFNPDTKHYLGKDIFTVLAALPTSVTDFESAKAQQDTLQFNTHQLNEGDTVFLEKCYGILEKVDFRPERKDFESEEHELTIGLKFRFENKETRKSYPCMPILGLKGSLVYQYPDKIDALGLQLKIDERSFDQNFTAEDRLNYQKFEVQEQNSFELNPYQIKLIKVNRNPNTLNYTPKEGDIAVVAELEISDNERNLYKASPIFIIRGNQLYNIKDYIPELGMHLRFSKVDPAREMMEIQVAFDQRKSGPISVQIAENVPRSDIIYLEAQIFPLINFVWLGSLLMLFGLLLSLIYRFKEREPVS